MSIYIVLTLGVILVIVLFFIDRKPKKPESLKNWGVVYYGERGSGKTLHQADQIIQIVKYWTWLWKKYPSTKHGIIITNQVLSAEALKEIGEYTHERVYFHFDEGDEMRFCPRLKCWRGEKKHMLHGAVVVLDDIATYLPADGWQTTPYWMRKQWTQAQHLGLHFLFNCQDPFAYDINARRATQIAYRFEKTIGSLRPDETAKAVKKIWGIYLRRKIKAKWLWQWGDMEPEQIEMFKDALNAQEQIQGKRVFRGIWKTTAHWISLKKAIRYDTLQDVKEYEPKGYVGVKKYDCIDSEHNHTEKDLTNYTPFREKDHTLV